MDQLSRYIWQIYGDFLPGAHGLPRPGDILRYYRLYREKTEEEVAAALACSTETLDDVEQHRLALGDTSKREAAAIALAIPPLLLGLPPYDAPLRRSENLAPEEFNELLVMSGTPVLEPLIVATYLGAYDLLSFPNDEVPAASYERTLIHWIQHLQQCISRATGVECDQYRALSYEFLYHLGWHELQQGNLTRAFIETTHALEQGYPLANAELIISGLDQRIAVLLKQEQKALAIQDFEAALWYAEIFYQAMNHPARGDAYPAAAISSSYTKIEDAMSEEPLVERVRGLHDRTLSVVLEGKKARPTEVFSLLERRSKLIEQHRFAEHEPEHL